jgi:hypothetical protein
LMLRWSALRDHNLRAEMARGEGDVPLLDPVGNDGASMPVGSSSSLPWSRCHRVLHLLCGRSMV